MSEAITQLTSKGNFIFDSEAKPCRLPSCCMTWTSDPFSHVLEDTIVKESPMKRFPSCWWNGWIKRWTVNLVLPSNLQGRISKRFLHQLVSGQLDMDRTWLSSPWQFYTGVTEGNIGSAESSKCLMWRMTVSLSNPKVSILSKISWQARRLMYWQVYCIRHP